MQLIKWSYLKKKVLLVVTKKNKFIGTVTDGDFRRFFLMNDKNYKLPISLLASKNASVLSDSKISKQNIIKDIFLSTQVNYIPVLDSMNKPVGILDRDDYLGFKNKNNLPIVIMAGGFGKRLGSLTKKFLNQLFK